MDPVGDWVQNGLSKIGRAGKLTQPLFADWANSGKDSIYPCVDTGTQKVHIVNV